MLKVNNKDTSLTPFFLVRLVVAEPTLLKGDSNMKAFLLIL